MSGIIFPGYLPYNDRYGNAIYTDFRNMLNLEAVFDEDMDDNIKMLFAIKLIYGNELPENMTVAQAINELQWFYSCGKFGDAAAENREDKTQRIYDFQQDADYVLAAFLSAYNIDLTDERLKMHWWKFMALFVALPEDTQMSKRMYYRSVDTTKMKGSQKKEYERLKKSVALKRKKPVRFTSPEELENKTKARVRERFEQAKTKIKTLKTP